MSELGFNEELLAVLYALLHDIGKPILRYKIAKESREGQTNRSADDLLDKLMKYEVKLSEQDRDESSRRLTHEELSKRFVKYFLELLGLSAKQIDNVSKSVEEIAVMSDRASAVERGLMPEDKASRQELWKKIQKVAEGVIGRPGFEHHTSPLLSPLWRLEYTGYRDSVGPCARSSCALEENYRNSEAAKVLRGFEEGRFDEQAEGVIRKIFESRYWLPVKPLTPSTLSELKLMSISDAINGNSYGDVLGVLHDLVIKLAEFYKKLELPITKGLVNSLESVLQVSTSLVPSAVWVTPVPDISLYSHSKSTAALAHVYWRATKRKLRDRDESPKARLLRIELNGIQDFVSSVISERAASRVIRGRSILIELLQDALARLLLEFLELSKSSIVISEGGGLTLLIPTHEDIAGEPPDAEERGDREDSMRCFLDKVLKCAYDELASLFRAKLWITVALSKPFSLSSLRGVDDPESEFARVVRDLIKTGVLTEKARASGVKAERLRERALEKLKWGLHDTLSDDIVRKDDRYWLEVVEGDEYANLLAPGKLVPGDVLSPITHLNLVCGSTARNLIAVVGISAYRHSDDIRRYVPDDKFVEGLVAGLMSKLKETTGSIARCVLLGRVGNDKVGYYTIGLVPFVNLGTIYILVSLTHLSEKVSYSVKELEGYYKAALNYIIYLVQEVLKEKSEVISKTRRRVTLSLKLVNNTEAFIPADELLLNELGRLKSSLESIGAEFDVEFAPYFVNTYHPVVKEDSARLKDLDEMRLIAVAKMDVDRLGDVLTLFTYSLSRLVDFSNTMTVAFNMKVHLMTSLGALENVIVLYSGGDDASIYGEWDEVLSLVYDIYNKVVEDLLKPLTVSMGVSIGKPKAPLLYLYREALAQLSRAKEVRASVSIDLLDPYVAVKCGEESKIVRAIPLKCDGGTHTCFTSLAELLKKLADHEELKKFDELRSVVYAIGELAATLIRYAFAERRSEVEILLPLINYAYLCARREKELRKLAEFLSNFGRLPMYPDAKLVEIYVGLLDVKPLIDLALLKLRSSRERS